MTIARLSLTDFRSYPQATIEPGAGLIVLTGPNGAGKTNILEAISMLTPGRGLRGAKLSEMARDNGGGGWAVAARLREKPLLFRGGVGVVPERADASVGEERDSTTPNPSSEEEGDISLGTGTTSAAPERRQVRINGVNGSATALSEWLSVLWLTPAMDRLFADTPGARRRFLDRLVLALHPGHARHAARYEAAMRARNRLLADERPLDERWCAALEAQMAEHGLPLAIARAETIDALNEAASSVTDGTFARPRLALEGWSGGDLAAELAKSRPRDRAAGRSLAGPHRSDLLVTHAEKGRPAASCSTGEQKALLLSIVLAHADLVAARTGRRPILLLDEVAAHLDPVRRAALFERLHEGGGQVWMTGTEIALFAEAGAATRFDVADGAVMPR